MLGNGARAICPALARKFCCIRTTPHARLINVISMQLHLRLVSLKKRLRDWRAIHVVLVDGAEHCRYHRFDIHDGERRW